MTKKQPEPPPFAPDPELIGYIEEGQVQPEPEPEPAKRLVCAVCELPAGTCFHPVNHVKEI